jgi:hypothetical protein
VSVSEIFDMLAGSETGALIASYLSTKDSDSRRLEKFFKMNTDSFFDYRRLPPIIKFVLTALVLGVIGSFTYFMAEKWYSVPRFDEVIDYLQTFLKMLKKRSRKKFFDKQYLEKLHNSIS